MPRITRVECLRDRTAYDQPAGFVATVSTSSKQSRSIIEYLRDADIPKEEIVCPLSMISGMAEGQTRITGEPGRTTFPWRG